MPNGVQTLHLTEGYPHGGHQVALRGHILLKVPVGNNSALFNSAGMPSNSTNEWNLLKEEFDALVRNEGGREESLEQLLDYQVRRRFGELIAWAATHQRGARRPDPDRGPR